MRNEEVEEFYFNITLGPTSEVAAAEFVMDDAFGEQRGAALVMR
ncbi:hypothetical protein [Corynebacterium cystitidis]|nr:hypothetical protein [Corynebacterium cystitidis]